MSFLDLSFMFSSKLDVQIQTECYYFGNIDKDNNTYYFLDVQAKYKVLKNKLTLSIAANNLFNTDTFRSYSISDISISNTEYRLQPRYVLLKAEYRF